VALREVQQERHRGGYSAIMLPRRRGQEARGSPEVPEQLYALAPDSFRTLRWAIPNQKDPRPALLQVSESSHPGKSENWQGPSLQLRNSCWSNTNTGRPGSLGSWRSSAMKFMGLSCR
jgi:hypothetical protein